MSKKFSLFIKYFACFIFFFLLFSVIASDLFSYDFIWNYGFGHAIRRGEIPYLDFNMISTPLYSFLAAIVLMIWDNSLMFLIFQASLCTVLVFLLFKYAGRKAWLLILIMAFPLFKAFIGTYNFLALVIIVCLFLAEDRKMNDLFLGVLLGLLIFTKQTIGGIALIVNLLFLGDFWKIRKRLLGVCIPGVIFLIYFLLTGSLKAFIDLCFLGLFDFGTNNGNLFSFLGLVSFLLVVVIFIRYKKTKDINCSYAIGAFFLAFPLFDYYHFSMFFTVFVLLFVRKIKLSEIYIERLSRVLLLITVLFNIFIRVDGYKDLEFLGLDKFNYLLVNSQETKKFLKLAEEYQKYDNSVMVGDHAMIMDIAANRKMSYFDMTLKGNYGYNGTKKMLARIDDMSDIYFFIDVKKLEAAKDTTQLDYKLLKEIIKQSRLEDSFLDYKIYYKE